MNNRQFLPEQDAPVQEKYPNRYKKGQSGNPGGRPKKTAVELKAIQQMKKLTPQAVEIVKGILMNEKASFYARLQAAEIIFNRAMGRPETYLKVDNTEQSVQASVERLQALFGDEEDESSGESVPVEEEPEEETDGDDSGDKEINADAG